jgi:hypothetical protein
VAQRDLPDAAAGLAARGFGNRGVLAIWSPNVPKYAVADREVRGRGSP